ncbi:D-TA family PLP-dependent enzyme [Aquirufa salirivi]|uniref:D-TA family PLP-dependent enzyme n=1 Tax=Aquirufa salirivi TaxID=3104729 RepID=A0ABW8RVN7_9BACT
MSIDYTEIQSPGLLVFPYKVKENIAYILSLVDGDPNRLRPHIKTHKTKEVNDLCLEAGITKFKCATIAEAELLALSFAPSILLSMQPTGPNIIRLANLVQAYPKSQFACLVDDLHAAQAISSIFQSQHLSIDIFIDINVGMNRTGIISRQAVSLIHQIKNLPALKIWGLHAYDGHIRDLNVDDRKAHVQRDFIEFETLVQSISSEFPDLELCVGGTPSFLVHHQNPTYVCSPGTFVFFDAGYTALYPENSLKPALFIISRIISKPSKTTICLDLGHKSVAAENTIENRVRFIDQPEFKLLSQSEEHGIVEVPDSDIFEIGQEFLMIPYHVCPTVALHANLQVIENDKFVGNWEVKARNRKINI